MKSNNNTLYGLLVAVVVLGALLLYYIRNRHSYEIPPPKIYKTGKDLPCPGPIEEHVMDDDMMAGVLNVGQKYKVITNYYACHPLEKGELVFFRYSNQAPPVPRFVRARQGDRFELKRDKSRGNWNVVINGELQKGLDGQPYYFGGEKPSVLSLYYEPNKGRIGDKELIMLSANPPGRFDSGTMGLLSVEDVVGKVIIADGSKNGEDAPQDPAEKVESKESDGSEDIKE